MIHVGRRSYPYMEEVNEGIVCEFRRLTQRSGRALDIGCGRGQLGEAVRALGWSVWGVETSDEACAVAAKRLNGIVKADLTDYDRVRTELGSERFDALIFSDVLEHVYDPRTVLERYLKLLAPGGRVFVSVPNAVVWTHRFQWLVGRVRYEDTGVMDRTHIRFFTFDTAQELVSVSGCRVARVSSTPYLVRAVLPRVKGLLSRSGAEQTNPRALIDSGAFKTYMKAVYPVERTVAAFWPGMLAFRIIVVGVKP